MSSKFEYIIWGTGYRAQYCIDCFLPIDRISAFIDNDVLKQGAVFHGKPVISFENYKTNYRNLFIIISPFYYKDIVDQIENAGIYSYFVLSQNPQECYSFGRKDILHNLPFELDFKKEAVIYGINLFSIEFMLLLENKGVNTHLVPHEELKQEQRNIFKKVFPNNYKENFDFRTFPGNVYLAINDDKKDTIKKYYNIYDFTYQIPEYHSEECAKLHNIHIGESCFIIGNGPSLKAEDLNTISQNHIYSFGVNRIFEIYNNTIWRPDLYIAMDKRFLEEYYNLVLSQEIPNIFISDCFDCPSKKGFRFHNSAPDPYDSSCRFSNDISWIVESGFSIVYVCMQFAAYMGFKTIYLLGVDMNYSTIGAVGNHFYKLEGRNSTDFNWSKNIEYFHDAKTYADLHGIKIYNATRGGALEVFPRVEFDSLFEK